MTFILWTIRLSLACYVVATACLLDRARGTALRPVAKIAWTAASLLVIVHVAGAFAFEHGWSHERAYDETARQTAEVVGIRFGGGVYVNYAFMIIWFLDALWWWTNEASYRARPRWLHLGLHAFVAFIIFNATVVFGHGAIRWWGLAGTVGLTAWWSYNVFRKPRAAPTTP